MAGSKTDPKKVKATKGGTNGAKTGAKVVKADKTVDLAAEEKKLRDSYPERKIVTGSIKDAGHATTVKEFGNKRTVEIKCECGTTRRVATSDLHQVTHCETCIKSVRLQRRKDQRAAKRKKDGKPARANAHATAHATGAGTAKKPAAKSKQKPVAKKAIKVQKPAKTGTGTPPNTGDDDSNNGNGNDQSNEAVAATSDQE